MDSDGDQIDSDPIFPLRADSPLQSVNELDRPGNVVGINTDDSVGVWLQQRLKVATIRSTPDYSLRDTVQWLQVGSVVAFAGGRQRLGSGTRDVSGLRLLADNFYGVPQSIAVPLERTDRLALVNAATSCEQADSSRKPLLEVTWMGLRWPQPRRQAADESR